MESVFLEQLGVVEKKEGFTIVDFEKLKQINFPLLDSGSFQKEKKVGDKRVIFKSGRIPEGAEKLRVQLKKEFKDYWSSNSADFLFDVFYDQKVISEDDWKSYKNGENVGRPKAKDLFYNPQSKQEAFDIESIKKADFYLGLWQLTGRKGRDDSYSRFNPDLNMFKTSLACLIYHPNFGDGERDENGDLVVSQAMTRKNGSGNMRSLRRRISVDRMFSNVPMKYLSKNAPEQARKLFFRTPEVLAEGGLPHLSKPESGKMPLLRAEDFAVLSNSEYAKKYGIALSIRELTSTPFRRYLWIGVFCCLAIILK